jgi:hypothetical protein
MTAIARSASRGGRHGLGRATAALLWRFSLLSYFSPVRHGWSRRVAVATSMLVSRRARQGRHIKRLRW